MNKIEKTLIALAFVYAVGGMAYGQYSNDAVTSAGGGGSPGGSNTQLQYNNSSSFGGIAGAVTDGTVTTFTNDDLRLLGSSTGYLQFHSANAGASNFTVTVPAVTDTLVNLTSAQTLSNKTLTSPVLNSPTSAGYASIISSGVNGYSTIFSSTTNGAVIRGQGSTNDVTFANASSTIVAQIPTGTTVFQLNATSYASCTALTTDSAGKITCSVSAMRFKIPQSFISPQLARTSLDTLRPASWFYKDKAIYGPREHVGLYADDVAKMDPRCAVYDNKGQLKNYEDRCVLAYLVADRDQTRSEIKQFRKEIDELQHRR